MSKLACTCGHVIYDQAASLPYKAHLFANQDANPLVDEPAGQVAAYAALADDERRRRWLAERFGPQYPTDMPLEAVAVDLMASTADRLTRDVYECEGCGTIWIQRTPLDHRFQPYTPAPGNQRGILRSVRQTPDEADGTAPA